MVVGGGIVGLAVARSLQRLDPGTPVIVLEKEPAVGAHQTGHNSGVVHSGLYYRPGSLKARFAVAGGAALREYCAEKGIPLDVPGKLVVATSEAELPQLDRLFGIGQGGQAEILQASDRFSQLSDTIHLRGCRPADGRQLRAHHRERRDRL